MPKPSSTKPVPTDSLHGSWMILSYGGRRVFAKRSSSYLQVVQAAKKHFPQLKGGVALQTADLGICGGQLVDIPSDAWDELSREISVVHLIHEDVQHGLTSSGPNISFGTPISPTSGSRITFNVLTLYGKKTTLNTYRSTKTISCIAEAEGLCEDDCRVIYCGRQISDRDTPDSLNMKDGDNIHLTLRQRGGKPVIYLFAPQGRELEAQVSLALVPQWEISVVYPVVPVQVEGAHKGQCIEWNVKMRPDGILLETTTGLEVAYLFWEACTNATIPPSPPTSPLLMPVGATAQQATEHFDPLTATLLPSDSILLPVATITPYLDAALGALGLHTEARTSFITYWLPSLLKHAFVALRFVSQDAYERAASLVITPKPDVVTRVFMLFKGVDASDAEEESWSKARARAGEDVGRWKDIVGVDVEKAADATLFRVLEWGGMEVLTL